MRKAMLMVLAAAAAAAGAVSADAQVLGGPALPEGSTRELSFSVTQPEIGNYSTSGAGVAVGLRRMGPVNLSLRLSLMDQMADAEVGTFGALPLPRLGGVDAGWTAGLGYNGVGNGLYLPVGVNLSRSFQLGAARIAPFVHGRVSLVEIDPPERELGYTTTATEVGVDVGAGTRWSVRVGIGREQDRSQLLLGFAWRR